MKAKEEQHVRSRRPCPRCGEEMWIVERKGQKLDMCHRCKGLWFDSSELDSVLGGEGRIELLIGIKASVRGERLECPECKSYMESKDIFGIFVDMCPGCGGIWMDSGETEKIWSISQSVISPFNGSKDEMDSARFWDPFKRTQQPSSNGS
jgi:hypothetical protein